MLLLAVLGGELPNTADPCEWVKLTLCKHSTGIAVESFQLSGFNVKGTEYRMISDIIAVIPLTTTEDCVLIITRTATTAVVQGSEADILKQLNPEGCK